MSTDRPLWWRHATQPAAGLARRLVLVTDVDGSLLEAGGRSLPAERAALDFLAARGVPLVIHSSRTRAEIERLHQTLQLLTPFISELGSALFVPHGSFPFTPAAAQPAVGGSVIEFGRRYHDVVEVLRRTSHELDIKVVGFAELTIEDVARELRVPIVEAQLAKLREYTELFRILDEKDATRSRLIKALRRRGLRCWRLGEHHLATATRDRVESLATFKRMWREAWGEPLIVGVGDSEDDVAWLQHVNIAVFVQHSELGVPTRALSRLPAVHVTRSPGRTGWSEAIVELVGALLNGADHSQRGNGSGRPFDARADEQPP